MSGGRYDGLITRFLGRRVPAASVSLGLDRLAAALVETGLRADAAGGADIFVIAVEAGQAPAALRAASALREAGLSCDLGFAAERHPPVRDQLRLASERGTSYALILGPEEVDSGTVTPREMATREQERVPALDLVQRLHTRLAEAGQGKPGLGTLSGGRG